MKSPLSLHADEFVRKGQVFDLTNSLDVAGIKGAIVLFSSAEKITLQQVKLLNDLQRAHRALVFVVVAQRLPSRTDVMMSMDAVRADYHVIFDPQRVLYENWGADPGGMALGVNKSGEIESRVAVPEGLIVGPSLNELKKRLEEMIGSVETSSSKENMDRLQG